MKQAEILTQDDLAVDKLAAKMLKDKSTAWLQAEAHRIYQEWHFLHRNAFKRSRFVFFRTQIMDELDSRGESI